MIRHLKCTITNKSINDLFKKYPTKWISPDTLLCSKRVAKELLKWGN
jgi:hypothetical protein